MEIRLRPNQCPVLDYPVSLNWKQARTNVLDLFRDAFETLKSHSCHEMLKRLKKASKPLSETSIDEEYHLMWCGNSKEADDEMGHLCAFGVP